MSYLSKVSSGIQKDPPFILLYGTPKVGKTTFAAHAPSPIILDIEQGSKLLKTNRIFAKSYADVVSTLKEISTEKHDYQTVVIDSLDHLEPLVWANVCRRENKKSIEDVGGGFQKGYVEALTEWQEIIGLLKECREKKGMMIICIAHVHVKTINDPMQIAGYDKFELKFHAKASALFKENADAILFAKSELLVAGGSEKKKGKAVGEGKRILYTQGMPGYEAGNRYNLPSEMDLDFKTVYQKMLGENEFNAEEFKNQIRALSFVLTDELKEKALKALEDAGNNEKELKKVYNRIIQLQGEKPKS